jgi:hypothetical protein
MSVVALVIAPLLVKDEKTSANMEAKPTIESVIKVEEQAQPVK